MVMLQASGPPTMEAYRVSRAVNTPPNNRPDLCGRFIDTPIRTSANLRFPQLATVLVFRTASYNVAPGPRFAAELGGVDGQQM